MRGYVVLETGECFEGVSLNQHEKAGEVVFNTSHSGYEEIATDPSYYKQIMVMSAPMQGNYGVDKEFWESGETWIRGFVALEIQNSTKDQSWLKRLNENSIPALSQVDTRTLVLRLRSKGTPWGAVVHAKDKAEALLKARKLISETKTGSLDWVHETTTKKSHYLSGSQKNGLKVAVLDLGSKANILRELQKRCQEIQVFPSRASVEEIRQYNPSGILLTNGPGDPSDVEVATDTVRNLLGWKPIFGICMGHQVLAIALGAKTFKLKFGHRGSNHPIKDELLNRIYMTSQNHGYAVERESLPSSVSVTHTNLNDGTVAGLMDQSRKCMGVQFHPESHPGPHDSVELFDYFVSQLK